MDESLRSGLNEHLALEYRAWYTYLAMSIWLDDHDLPGCARWMQQQSADELSHAQRIVDHLLERDLQIELSTIDKPEMTWASVLEVFEQVLEAEREVTASIHALFEASRQKHDHPAQLLLEWFVKEQVEEENVARAILGRLKLAGDSGVGLLMVDQELASGMVPGAMAEPSEG